MDQISENIQNGCKTAFIDYSTTSNLAFQPRIITNDDDNCEYVLNILEQRIRDCECFYLSVAFISWGGISKFKSAFREFAKKGDKAHGYILATDYKLFNEPNALDFLLQFSNIELKLYKVDEDDKNGGFHTKGYIFKKNEKYNIIIGSSNLTFYALTKNKEWNTETISTQDGKYTKQILSEFEKYWNSEKSVYYKDYKDCYKERFQINKKQKQIALHENPIKIQKVDLEPNDMQAAFISNMRKLRAEKKDHALLISATGTGKTYASAFEIRTEVEDENLQRMLFIVHRKKIAKQAKQTFENVFSDKISMGLYFENYKETNARFIFSTLDTLRDKDKREKFSEDAFDTIIIDEVHRAGSNGYQQIMNYFKPKLWLGMSATPERSDDFDIFSLFKHNIAYEIRLQQALKENLLCPFDYYGISDLQIDGKTFSDDDFSNFNKITSDQRVEHIIREIKYYGYSGERVKGLIFVNKLDVADELSKKFNERGYRTVSLHGGGDEKYQEYIENCIDRLTDDSIPREEQLDYLFTVDIFNEGVDIPEINQIVMLRPTKSIIIFVQQLGRGLRKHNSKEFVTILDFIGNYNNNYLIPMALTGSKSYDKDDMRKPLTHGQSVIPGAATIHFDEITRKRILKSIDRASTNSLTLLHESYKNLKYRLGRIPTIKDFDENDVIDVEKFFTVKKSYYEYLIAYEDDFKIQLADAQRNILKVISNEFAIGVRPDELIILSLLIQGKADIISEYQEVMKLKYNIEPTNLEIENVIANLTNNFRAPLVQSRNKDCIFITSNNGTISINQDFQKLLENNDFKNMVSELIEHGLMKYEKKYSELYQETRLSLWKKYTVFDVEKLLGWDKEVNAQSVGGYWYNEYSNTFVVFINYKKDNDAIPYEDKFLSQNEIIAISKNPRKIDSSDADKIFRRSAKYQNTKFYLFVRKDKNDLDAKEYYFLGAINSSGEPIPDKIDGKIDIFKIHYLLETPVETNLYNYILEDIYEID